MSHTNHTLVKHTCAGGPQLTYQCILCSPQQFSELVHQTAHK